MFLVSGPQEWLSNFFVDSLNFIFTNILDFILYGVMGMLFKVYLLIGSFDLFGGFSDGTEAAVEIYQAFANRLYGALGIIVMFVLAYQIILFIIDPDKGIKQSKQLVTNLVKAIIMVILCPLVFHYAAVVQHHFLVEDNVVWRMVLGTGSQSNDVREAGNAVPGMIYVMMFHPAASTYDDFYDSEGKLNSVETACANYDTATSEAEVADDSFSLGKLIKGGFTVAFHAIMPEAALAIDASQFVIGLIKSYVEGHIKMTTCEYYYSMLYFFGQKDPSTPKNKDELHALTDYNESTIGYHNMAMVLAASTVLSAEIYPENEMEYYHFSPVAAVAIIIFLFGYTLDIAHRAFKLAFLQMIAPIPILLGVVPKNEKIYTDWRSSILKTYLEIFVRTFVFAFIILMIQLLPTFLKAMMSAWDFEDGPGFTQAIAFLVLIVGLLRFGQELPKLITDFMKNSPGFLSGIDLNPVNSMKKSKAALDKPVGFVAGGAMGAISARNAVKAKGGNKLDRFLATARGLQTGAKTGAATGINKGMITNSMMRSNAIAVNDMSERNTRMEQLRDKDYYGFFNGLSQGRLGQFESYLKGRAIGVEDSILQNAGLAFQSSSNGIIQTFKSAGAKATERADDFRVEAEKGAHEILDQNGNGTGMYTAKFGNKDLVAHSREELQKQINSEYTEYIRQAQINKLSSSLALSGYEGIADMANSERDLYSEYYDSLKAYPKLQESLKKAASKWTTELQYDENGEVVIDAATGEAAHKYQILEDMLKTANGGVAVDYSNTELVSKLIGSDGFRVQFETLSDDDSKLVVDGVSTMYRDVAKADESIATEISNIKGRAVGTQKDLVNRDVNNLAKKPDKK